jgi:hypothetical protein
VAVGDVTCEREPFHGPWFFPEWGGDLPGPKIANKKTLAISGTPPPSLKDSPRDLQGSGNQDRFRWAIENAPEEDGERVH